MNSSIAPHHCSSRFRLFIQFLGVSLIVFNWSGCSTLPDSGRLTSSETVSSLQVHVVDVGYGESIIIISPGRRAILWDGGYKAAYPKLKAYIHSLGIKKFDCMFSTHPHPDHIEGLMMVLQDYQVQEVRGAFPLDHDDVPDKMGELLHQRQIRYTVMKRGDDWNWVEDISFHCLNPEMLIPDMNDSSLVCQIRWKNHRILLTSDVGPRAQKELTLRYKQVLRSNFMTIPHHGGNCWPDFFKAVDPTYLSLSVGENPWGNPAQKTLDFLDDNGLDFSRTDEIGTIMYSFWPDGKVSQQLKVTVTVSGVAA